MESRLGQSAKQAATRRSGSKAVSRRRTVGQVLYFFFFLAAFLAVGLPACSPEPFFTLANGLPDCSPVPLCSPIPISFSSQLVGSSGIRGALSHWAQYHDFESPAHRVPMKCGEIVGAGRTPIHSKSREEVEFGSERSASSMNESLFRVQLLERRVRLSRSATAALAVANSKMPPGSGVVPDGIGTGPLVVPRTLSHAMLSNSNAG